MKQRMIRHGKEIKRRDEKKKEKIKKNKCEEKRKCLIWIYEKTFPQRELRNI